MTSILHVGNDLYGMKKGVTYKLGQGNQIDGAKHGVLSNRECPMLKYIAEKEFIRIRVNSNSKPKKIFFYNDYQSYIGDNFTNVVDANAVPSKYKRLSWVRMLYT
jgi:homoserine acetyltransferase